MTKIIIKKLTLQIIFVYMNFYKNILKSCCVALLFLSAFSCTEKGVIPAKKMSRILSEMYLADQYAEITPQLRGSTDSMKLYTGIIQKFGYTETDYINSIRYYMSKSKDMLKIHINAKQILTKRKKELEKIVPYLEVKKGFLNSNYDSDNVDTLFKNPYNRAVKWLISPYLYGKTDFFALLKSDIPANSKWWNNNIYIKSDSLSLYKPIDKNSRRLNESNKKTDKSPATVNNTKIVAPKEIDEIKRTLNKNLKKQDLNKLRKELRKENKQQK